MKKNYLHSPKESGMKSSNNRIDITPMKKFARLKMHKTPHLRELIIAEKDSLTKEEFLQSMKIWLRLFDIEEKD